MKGGGLQGNKGLSDTGNKKESEIYSDYRPNRKKRMKKRH